MEKTRTIDKLQFLTMMTDPEQVFLVKKEDNELYLIADMEIVDEFSGLPSVRTETMCFKMKNNELFLGEAIECRTRYCGGIYINDNVGKSSDTIFDEFVNIAECARFFCCNNDKVGHISPKLNNGMNYILIC